MSDSWNIGKLEKSGLKQGTETAVLVGVVWDDLTEEIVDDYLDEMEFLALTAGAVTKNLVVYRRLGSPALSRIGFMEDRKTLPRALDE